VTNIGYKAFFDNPLLDFTIYPDNTELAADGFFVISKERKEIISYCGNDKNITIPEGVTSIGTGAFWGYGITNVSIPDSVISIGANAFRDNELTTVAIPDSVRSIGNYAFDDNSIDSFSIGSNVELGDSSIGDYLFYLQYNMSWGATDSYTMPRNTYGFGRYWGTYYKAVVGWRRR
jgi:hypothetical protein